MLTRKQKAIVREQTKAASKMDDQEFMKFARKVLAEHVMVQPSTAGLVLKFPYDLRGSMEAKVFDCSQYARWTAFVNNAGTLCHVVSDEGEILIRLKFTYPLKHLNEDHMLRAIRARVENYIKL